MTSLLPVLALLANGLYAGFLLAFRTAVMPGLADLTDARFTAAMRSFNARVPGPAFLALFLGAVALPAAAFLAGPGQHGSATGPALLGALACALAGHGVTVAGNIPLNNALAAAEGGDDGAARTAFEARWNTFHRVRTMLALAACALLAVAL